MEKIILPMLGETMEEGTIGAWKKKEGERVAKGEILLEIITDKATLEVESPASGILRKIVAKEGEVVPVLRTIGWIGEAGEAIPEEQAVETGKEQKKSIPVQQAKTVEAGVQSGRIIATPAARRVAQESGIDLSTLKGTGPDGRITEEDVRSAGKSGAKPPAASHGEVVPLTPMRRIIAEKMTRSKTTIPHYYLRTSVDMSAVMKKRQEDGKKYSYNDVLIKVSAAALKEFPSMNSSFEPGGIRYNKRINIGIAVALHDGLVVPVVRDADKKPFTEVAEETARLISQALENKLTPDKFSGGTFTITNLGMYEIDEFIAVINPPETAILAVGRITSRQVIVDGKPEVRSMMNITLSVDHRTADGAYAAKFLQKVKKMLESGQIE